MSELKRISIKVLALILDIIHLAYKVIKQISLPNRKRKGNLLSSVFIFFIGTIERLNFFEHGIFSMAAVLRKKYVKQTIFLIGFVLFLLSLFEWTGDQRFTINTVIASAEQPSPNIASEKTVDKQQEAKVYSYLTLLHSFPLTCSATFHNFFPLSSSVKKFLLIRSLRI